LGMHAVDMRLVGGVDGVRVGVGFPDGFGEVFGQIPDGPVCVFGDDTLQIQLRAEPQHMRRLSIRVRVESVEGLLPGREHLTGIGVDVVGPGPHRYPLHIDGLIEGGPPQRVIGGLDDPAEDGPGMAPRIAACRCGAKRCCASMAEKYCTLNPAHRRRLAHNRPHSFEKCSASSAARR
jgi:hypothetical protein